MPGKVTNTDKITEIQKYLEDLTDRVNTRCIGLDSEYMQKQECTAFYSLLRDIGAGIESMKELEAFLETIEPGEYDGNRGNCYEKIRTFVKEKWPEKKDE